MKASDLLLTKVGRANAAAIHGTGPSAPQAPLVRQKPPTQSMPTVTVCQQPDARAVFITTVDEAKLTKTEKELLGYLRTEYRHVFAQAVTLKLANDCRFTPDFMVVCDDGTIRFHECKGKFAFEDSIIKLRTAARIWNCFEFWFCQKNGPGDWKRVQVMP